MDPRWQQVADLLVNYSAAVQPGERVLIAMHEVESLPLTQAVYTACIRARAYPQVLYLSETLRHAVLRHGDDRQLAWTPELEVYGMEWADVYFGLRGAYNLHLHADIPAARLAVNQAAQGRVSSLRWEKTRWCLVRVPNAAFAFQAETDLETISEMFFAACLLDWPAEVARWQAWADRLNRASEVHLAGRETDLTFSVQGRRWVVGDGKLNLPDGEIATAPIPASVDGQIYFEFPGVLGGRLIHDIRLRWAHGELVEATASTHQDYLRAILATDAGASRIGEFALGTNPHVTRFCKDILIDEKIGGTVHIALGRAYPASGGDNPSAIHWDIIKDIRGEGYVEVDGQIVLQGGQFFL
jgi:aminopeptidase